MLGFIAVTLIGVGGWYGLRQSVSSETARIAAPVVNPAKAKPADIPVATTDAPAPAAPGLANKPRLFGLGGSVRLEDVPAGRLHDRLADLSGPARARALKKLGDRRVPLNDVHSLNVDQEGGLFYECEPPAAPAPAKPAADPPSSTGASPAADTPPQAAPVPISSPPVRHSRPGASRVIYLDFNGQTITGTAWNLGYPGHPAVATYVAKPYDTDGDEANFSDTEQAAIIDIWSRVAEDFAPFDVDVTTEEPAVFTATTGRALITRDVDQNGVNMPSFGAGGVAYFDYFGYSDYLYHSPVFVYHNTLYGVTDSIAGVISHEMGHNLSLSHDGTLADEYYDGHGYGDISWGPIMGSTYYKNVTQWSKGEYYNASNPEDDLAIIAGHLGYKPDDHADSNGSATALAVVSHNFSGQGIITQTGEGDRFSFSVAAPSQVTISVATFIGTGSYRGGNLDAMLELFDAGGGLVASANPPEATVGSLSTLLGAGTYYVRVTGVGAGAPYSSSPTGYTAYGSLGAFSVSGFIGEIQLPVFYVNPSNQSVSVGATAQFSVAVTGGAGATYRWQRLPAGGSTWSDLADGGAYSGTGTPYLSIVTTLPMSNDQVRCVVTNPAGSATSNAATLTVNPVPPPVVSTQPSDTFAALGGSAYFSVSATGSGLAYQWYHNGVAIPGATFLTLALGSVATGDFGDYFLTISNSAGTVVSQTAYLNYGESTTTPAGSWIDAKEVDGVVYFLFADTPRIERYDLASETWLGTWTLPSAPSAFGFGSTALYVAAAGNVTKYTRSFTAPTPLTTGTDPVVAIFDTGSYLVVTSGIYPLNIVTSYQPTGQLVAATSGYYRSAQGFSFDGATGRLFGRTTGSSPSDIGRHRMLGDGTWELSGYSTYFDSPYHGALPDAIRTYVIAGGAVADNSGTVYRGADLTYAGSFGTAFTDLIPDGSGGYWLLRGGQVLAADAKYRETGSVLLAGVARKLAARTGNLFAFASPASAGGRPGVQKLATSLVAAPVAPAAINPVGRAIWAPKVSMAAGGNVYVYSKVDRQAFVWSPQNWSYQPALPVSSGSDVAVAGPGNRLYFTRNGTQVRTIAPGEAEQPFVGNVATVRALQGLGQQVALSDTFYNGLPIKLVSTLGEVTSTVGDTLSSYISSHHYTYTFAWDSLTSRLFQYRDSTSPNALLYSEVLPGGLLGSEHETAYSAYPTTTPPIRVSPDGTRVVLGSGETYQADTLVSAGNLGVAVKDVAWAGGALHTIRAAGGGTLVESWSASTLAALGSASFSGEPLSLLALKGDRLLLITTQSGVLSYRMLASHNRAVIDPTAAGVAPVIVSLSAGGSLLVGSTQHFSVVTTGGALPNYQWQILLPGGSWQNLADDANVLGSLTADLFIRSFASEFANASFRVVVTNAGGSVNSSPIVTTLTGPAAVLEVSAGGSGTFYLRSDGALWATGYNNYGQLGDGTTATRTTPAMVASNVVQVSASVSHTLYLKSDRTLWATGFNGSGQLGNGTTTSRSTAMQVATDVLSISAGTSHSLFIKADGSLWSVGNNNYGQLGDGTNTSSTTPVYVEANVVSCFAGDNATFYIKTDGTLWVCGSNFRQKLGLGTTTSYVAYPQLLATGVTSVVSGQGHTLFTKDDGSLWATGSSFNGQLGNGTIYGTSVPAQVATGVVRVAAGAEFTLFQKTDGSLWACGRNYAGQLGDGTFDDRLTPVQVAAGVVNFAAGEAHSLYTKADGSLWGAGGSSSGQLALSGSLSQKNFIRMDIGLWGAPLATPAGLTASDGTLSSAVLLTWQPVVGASSYQLWRNPANDRATATRIAAGTKGLLFGDRTASTGVTYYYWVQAENAAGVSAASGAESGYRASAALPVITAQPDSVNAAMGTNVTFSVSASSDPTAGFQWQQKSASGTWQDITYNGTNRTLTLYYVDVSIHGSQYRCVVTNPVGSVTSAAATLTVYVPLPAITAQPPDTALPVGYSLYLWVGVSSPVPVTYQWRKAGVDVPGATANPYFVMSAQLADAGAYSVVVTNSAGSVTSNAALITVVAPPVITTQPVAQSVAGGATFTFSVVATSTGSLTYQWRKNGVSIAGATGSSYTKTNAQLTDLGTYSVAVTNLASTVVSNDAVLTITSVAPGFLAQPVNLTAFIGGPASFQVTVAGDPVPACVWQRLPVGGGWTTISNGGSYSGATTTTLSISPVTSGMNGDQYRCIATNVLGSATSNVATLLTATAAFTKISAGRYHSLRLDGLSRLYATGLNTYGQLGTGNTTSTNTAQLVTLAGQTIADIAGSAEHSLILTTAREVWAVGLNSTGQLGDGTTVSKSTPVKVATNVVGMGANRFHSAFLKSDGTLWMVGGNDSGQLGNGNLTDTSTPVQVATGVVDLAVGIRQTLFIKSDGTLWGMGDLNGSGIPLFNSIQIATNVKAVAAGGYHSLFIKNDGTLWSLGYNAYGQLGVGLPLTDRVTPVQVTTEVKAVAAGYFFSLFLENDNTLWSMGYNNFGQLGEGTTNNHSVPRFVAGSVTAMSASESYTLFTTSDGSLWGTGLNASGQFGNGNSVSVTTPVRIATGVGLMPGVASGLTVAPTAAGDRLHLAWDPTVNATRYEVWRSATNDSSTATRIAQNVHWSLYDDLTAGTGVTYYFWIKAVNPVGSGGFSAPASGSSNFGAIAPVITTQPASQSLLVGSSTTFTLGATGLPGPFYQWQRQPAGSGTWFTLANGAAYSGVTTVSLGVANVDSGMNGDQFRCLVSNSVGSAISSAATLTVTSTVAPTITTQPTDLTVIVGSTVTFIGAASGSPAPTYQWRKDGVNLVNGGSISGATAPSLVLGNVQTGDAGSYTLVASNSAGNVTSNPALLAVSNGSGYLRIAAGRYHSLRLDTSGQLSVAGANTYGQLGNGTTTASNTPQLISIAGQFIVDVAAGAEHSLFLAVSGQLWGAGLNNLGQLGDGTTTARPTPVMMATGVAAMAGSRFHSAYLKTDGTLWTVGGNDEGQLGNGNMTDRSTAGQIASGVASVSAGIRQTLFVKTDGTLWGAGDFYNNGVLTSSPVQLATGVAAVAGGGYHSLILKTDGTLWALGWNSFGQLGTGNTTTATTPVQVATGVKAVATGFFHSLFLKTDNTLWAMGYNNYGQIGDGTTTNRLTPYQLATNVTAMSASEGYTLFTKADGSLWATGFNGNGQLGNGTTTTVGTAVQVATGTVSAVAPAITTQPVNQTVSEGATASYSITVTGSVPLTYQWQMFSGGSWTNLGSPSPTSLLTNGMNWSSAGPGDNGRQLRCVVTNSAGSVTSSVVTLTVSSTATAPVITTQPASQTVIVGATVTFTAAASGSPAPTYQWQVKRQGDTTWTNTGDGGQYTGSQTGSLTFAPVGTAETGDQYRCLASNAAGTATSNAATLTVSGAATAPLITTQPASQTVTAGTTVTFTAAASGSPAPTYQWRKDGSDLSGATAPSLVLGNVQTGDTGSYTLVAGNSAGSAISNAAVLTVNAVSSGSGYLRIAAGRYHSLRLDAGSQLYVTGANTYGQLGNGTTTASNTPQLISIAGQTIVDVAAGAEHSLFLTASGQLWGAGLNNLGQLGDGTTTARATPVMMATGVAAMAGSRFHSAYLKTDGTLWTVGGNDEGQLGNGNMTDRSTAGQIASGVASVSAGIRQTLFVKTDGTLWGAGDFYNNGVLTSSPLQLATGVAAVAGGGYHSLILKTDGTLWALGWNGFGQLGTGNTTTATTPVQVATGVKAVATGFFHSLFLKTDNTLWAMGYNNYGQIGDGTTTNRLTPYQLATNVTAMSASEGYTLFTKADGSLWATGFNGNGQLGNGTTTTVGTAVQVATGTVSAVAPAITTQPVNQTVSEGATASYSITVTGSVPLTYQWQMFSGGSWTNLGTPSPTSLLTNGMNWSSAGPGDNGRQLRCVVTNSAGSVTSSVVTLTVASAVAPAITTQPATQTVGLGTNVTLTVGASGTGPLSYQWRKGGTNLGNGGIVSGVTTATLVFTNVQTGDTGSYDVVVSNSAGSATSNAATLTVTVPTLPTTSLQLAAGVSHALILRGDGTLLAAGSNNAGQLGDGTTTSHSTPVTVATGIYMMAGGWEHSLWVKSDATLWAVGGNGHGQLGDGTTTNRLSPVPIATGVAGVAAGDYHSFYVTLGGMLFGMGANETGRLGDGTTTQRLIPVQIATGVASVSTGVVHSLFVKTDGTAWGMGRNGNGQIGDGTTAQRLTPVQIGTNVAAVAAGGYHGFMLKNDHTLWGFGYNGEGELGNGLTSNPSGPVQIATNVDSVSAGLAHSVFVKTDGTLWAMGDNTFGQLGNGTTTQRLTPVQVATGVLRAVAGDDFTLFFKTDGSVWAMGHNGSGQLGDGTTTNRVAPVQIYSAPPPVLAAPTITTQPVNQAATAGGSVSFTVVASGNPAPAYQWRKDGTNLSGATAATLTLTGVQSGDAGNYDVVITNSQGSVTSNAAVLTVTAAPPAITAQPASQTVNEGANVTLTVGASGTAPLSYQWRKGGTNLGNGGIVSGAATATLVLTSVQTGDTGSYDVVVSNTAGSATSNAAVLTVTTLPTTSLQLAAGVSHTLILRGDGTLLAAGSNNAGQLGDGTTTSHSTAVTAATGIYTMAGGWEHSLWVKSDASLWAVGGNGHGQLGDGTTTNRLSPVPIATSVAWVAAGDYHSFYVTLGGTLFAMGANETGRLGDGTTTQRLTPVPITTGVASVSTGVVHSLFVKADGTAWGMGRNGNGQIGDGTTTQRLTPVQIGTNVAAVAAGGYHGFMLKNDHTLWGFGYNGEGELGNGLTSNPSGPVQVATNVAWVSAGLAHSVFVKTDGTLWAMGDNTFGQLGNGTTTQRLTPVQVATGVLRAVAGDDFTLFFKTDGSVWAMGHNGSGQLGDGTTTNRLVPVRIY